MGTEGLYLTDAYLQRFTARVTSVSGREILLDRTAFHPEGGGQPDDLGQLDFSGGSVRIEGLRSDHGDIHHRAAGEGPVPVAGESVTGEIEWGRRHLLMRGHTMLHLLSGVVYRRFGSGITGGQIYEGRARMDFSLEGFGRPLAEELVAAVNDLVGQDRPIHVRFVSHEEAATMPALVRVATQLPAGVERVRLIDIEGFDVQADGGTHVHSTAEVGPVALGRLENKGARNKRLYLELSPPAPPESR
jgi:misacylated tRNA(Ala) deacylase